MEQLRIGTSWMIPPPTQQGKGDGIVDKQIGEMNLQELKRFMCPKSRGNAQECEKCPGRKSCTVGQRIAVLQDMANREQAPKQQKQSGRIENDRERFRQACASGNAWNHLIQQGMSEGAAREKLVEWMKRYPAIANENGGRKAILARPTAVRITRLGAEDGPVEPQEAQEQASEPSEAQTRAERTETQKEASRANCRKGADAMARGGLERCQEALDTGDPLKFLTEVKGLSEKQARCNISRWRGKHPELFEGKTFPNLGIRGGKNAKSEEEKRAAAIAIYRDAMEHVDPSAYLAEKEGIGLRSAQNKLSLIRRTYDLGPAPYIYRSRKKTQEAETEDLQMDRAEEKPSTEGDEISLADFLAGFEAATEETETVEPETQEAPETATEAATDPLVRMMDARYAELQREKEELEERIRCIEEQQAALAKTLAAFHLVTNTATGK